MNKRTRGFRLIALCALCTCLLLAIAGCTSSSGSTNAVSSKSIAKFSVADKPIDRIDYTEPFYLLVVGNDTRKGTVEIKDPDYADGNARSDTMMLVRIDPKEYKVTLVTIPRDTAATVDGHTAKINNSYRYHGMEGLLSQVKELTGVRPTFYFDMTFVQYENFVNGLGGVDAYVPTDMSLQDIVGGDNIKLTEGEHHLNGAEALVLARMRKIYKEDMEAVRQINDRNLVAAGITFVANHPEIVDTACDILVENSSTNWNAKDLKVLVADFAKNADKIEILSGTGPYTGDIEDGTWLATRDEGTWSELMTVVDKGGDPTSVVDLPKLVVD